MNEVLRSIIAECIKVDPSEITPEKGAGDFAQWDSLAQVMIISRVIDEFGINVPFDKLSNIESVQDFIDIVEE